MKKYILKGNDADVDKVVRENRIRVARGLIEFAPCDEGSSDGFIDDDPNGMPNPEDNLTNDGDEEIPDADNKDVPEADSKDVSVKDNKDVPEEDSKEASAEDSKAKKPKGKNPKTE